MRESVELDTVAADVDGRLGHLMGASKVYSDVTDRTTCMSIRTYHHRLH